MRTRSTVQHCHFMKNMSKRPFNYFANHFSCLSCFFLWLSHWLPNCSFVSYSVSFIFEFINYSSAQLNDKQKEMLDWTDDSPANCSLHVNKAICLLSHHPFGDTFEKWLRFIYVCFFLRFSWQHFITLLIELLFSIEITENVKQWNTFDRSHWTLHHPTDRRSAVSISKHFNSIIQSIQWTNYIDATGRLTAATKRCWLHAIAHQFRTR